jgi:SAM-dependent methyltransferase
MNFVCAVCHKSIECNCTCCGISYQFSDNKLVYTFDKLLFKKFRRAYFLNKELNNNGYLSYKFLSAGSISLNDRDDVKAFDEYIRANHKAGLIIDIGCGPMETPGYLEGIIKQRENTIIGLEPDANTRFKFQKIIGCAEFVPLPSKTMDSMIFATSLDHVCNLDATLKEAMRLLKIDGKLIIWHHYPEQSKFLMLKDKIINMIYYRYNTFRYVHYQNENIVLHIPRGAVDPFHVKYIKPETLTKSLERLGATLTDVSYFAKGSSFMTFSKQNS